jgi:hypothetical protein
MALKEVVLLMYSWVYKFPQSDTMMEVDVRSAMIINWYNYCQKLCTQICEHPSQVGRNRQIVETDKSNSENISSEKGVL